MILSKQAPAEQKILGEKLKQENIKTLKQENKQAEEAKVSTTPSSLQIATHDSQVDAPADVANARSNKDEKDYYLVTKVVDGDTIDVLIGTTTQRIRLIGVNTPEIVDPRKPVECFGREASQKAREFLDNKIVYLEPDDTQDNHDKYGRLLRYVWRADGLFYNLEIIKQGYAYEYTYFTPYQYQAEFKQAQAYAREHKLGLWAEDVCAAANNTKISASASSALPPNADCDIKGNVASSGEKIYHLPTCDYYAKTVINLEQGERWFCSEEEAVAVGWRKAQNCK